MFSTVLISTQSFKDMSQSYVSWQWLRNQTWLSRVNGWNGATSLVQENDTPERDPLLGGTTLSPTTHAHIFSE